jgi:hypothetical protein
MQRAHRKGRIKGGALAKSEKQEQTQVFRFAQDGNSFL